MTNISRFQKNTGVGQILDESFKRCPDNEAIIFGSWRIRYRELESLIYKTAHYMQQHGVKKGSCVGVVSRNCPEFIIAEMAILKLGATVVKFNWRLTPDEMEELLIRNECVMAFYKYENPVWGKSLMEKMEGKLEMVSLQEDENGRSALYSLLEGVSDEPIETVVEDDAPCHHMHTSGTTGKCKTVVYKTAHYLNQLESMLTALEFPQGLRYQFISQLFHAASLGAFLTLSVGGKLVLMQNFSIEEYVDSLIKEKIQAIGVIPLILKCILDYTESNHIELPDLEVVNYSTCPISHVLLERAVKNLHCRFYQSYGMTEMASTITSLSAEDHIKEDGKYLRSVGRAMPGAEIRIEAPDGSECPTGETGEICIKGRGVMAGYLGLEEQTAHTMRGGWYHSQDLGYLDENGYLFLRGRMDYLIISGGENIYPEEVSNVLVKMPQIQECAVFGVPDEKWGQHVKAAVVVAEGQELTEQEIKDFCRANMPSFRIPKEISFVPELPKNSTGKVIQALLK